MPCEAAGAGERRPSVLREEGRQTGLKFGTGPDDLREYYRLVSELFAMRERNEDPDQGFMEQLAKQFEAVRDYFPERE